MTLRANALHAAELAERAERYAAQRRDEEQRMECAAYVSGILGERIDPSDLKGDDRRAGRWRLELDGLKFSIEYRMVIPPGLIDEDGGPPPHPILRVHLPSKKNDDYAIAIDSLARLGRALVDVERMEA